MFWLDGQTTSAIAAPKSSKESDIVTITDIEQKHLIGHLGQPLGKIIVISGVVRQEQSGAKSSPRDVLSVESVNDRPLAQPVTIEFNLFMTAQVAKPILGQSFKYIGYETGGFTGIPQDAFKFVPAVATTGHRFNTFFQVLQEELDVVKTKSDLIQFNNRRVQIIGRYVSGTKPAPAITGDIEFKGNYITAKIVLEDGTEIPIFPTYNKQSLRSPEEAEAYNGKIVKVVGKISSDRLNSEKITLNTFDGIWQYQAGF
ncbi:MAG: hypothetical protein DCF19_11965 [Pseudanabaena frigida]|uniref:Uncharacterized protein n=1 Tax=Pseudanabaena frigida TaxID=945775 RepID=A0A2W4WFB5_9CYAN|nr:MAG: hypothetical protein DCF19_11965 [Pseudanabaena frigida]